MLNNYPEILNLSQVCEILSISKNTLYGLIRNDYIEAFRIGDKIWRIRKEDVINYCAKTQKFKQR